MTFSATFNNYSGQKGMLISALAHLNIIKWILLFKCVKIGHIKQKTCFYGVGRLIWATYDIWTTFNNCKAYSGYLDTLLP